MLISHQSNRFNTTHIYETKLNKVYFNVNKNQITPNKLLLYKRNWLSQFFFSLNNKFSKFYTISSL